MGIEAEIERASDDDLAKYSNACLLVRRRTSLAAEGDVDEIVRLADGASVIVTTAAMDGADNLAIDVGERHAAWTSEHDDDRGILLFPSTLLDEVAGCETYEALVAAVGSRGKWVSISPSRVPVSFLRVRVGSRRSSGHGP